MWCTLSAHVHPLRSVNVDGLVAPLAIFVSLFCTTTSVSHALCRQLKEDTVVCGYKLPAGTTISFPPYALHHSKDNYIRPEEFWPDRWEAVTGTKQPLDPGMLRRAVWSC